MSTTHVGDSISHQTYANRPSAYYIILWCHTPFPTHPLLPALQGADGGLGGGRGDLLLGVDHAAIPGRLSDQAGAPQLHHVVAGVLQLGTSLVFRLGTGLGRRRVKGEGQLSAGGKGRCCTSTHRKLAVFMCQRWYYTQNQICYTGFEWQL